MVDLIRTKDNPYSRKQKAGTVFKAPRSHARVLIALGHAAPAPKKEPPKKEAAEPRQPQMKRQYQRRDMTAMPTVVPTVIVDDTEY